MKALKALIFSGGLLFALALSTAAAPEAKAQSSSFSTGTMLTTANKIVYTANAVEIQDSVNKVAYVYKKGTFFVQTRGFSGGSYALIDSHSQRAISRGPVSAIRIVGVVNSDSLKILSLKATPF